MTRPILELKNLHTVVNAGTSDQLEILHGINLKINPGDFITIVGTNGAGKSTLFNAIAGTQPIAAGQIFHNGKDITRTSEEQRTKFLSRVFQDPKLGTAPRMTVAENLLLAKRRGSHRWLKPRHLKQAFKALQAQAAKMNNGLDQRMNTFVNGLSGGQRQALSFLMATIKRPDVLLLDEHTAALDPSTSRQLLKATNDRITQDHLTALMITHHLDDALQYGNRLLALKGGRIIADFAGQDKQALTVKDLYQFFDD